MTNKGGFNDKVVSFVNERLAGSMSKLEENILLASIKDGLTGATPIIILGSLFLLLAVVGQPWVGRGGPIIPFLSPYSNNLLVAFNLTMGILSLYTCIGIAMSYGKRCKLDLLSSALIGLMSFLLITTNDIKDGSISIAAFGASGLFTAIISSIFAVWIYGLCLKGNLIIKMPKGVPQGVGNAFSALIPFAIVGVTAWGIRTFLGFDLTTSLSAIIKPLFQATDNIFVFTAKILTSMLLWVCGIHGDNMLEPIFSPLKTAWIADNAAAAAKGVALTNLPHIWTQGVERMVIWTSSAWGLIFWMWTSKVKYIKSFAAVCTPAGVFTIIEPLLFGLPLVMNPIFIIPFILSATIASIVTYGAMLLHLCSRLFIDLPWATPPPIYAYLGTGGDWRAVVLVAINFFIGVVIYYPFFKAFEKSELEKERLSEEVAVN